MQLCDYIVTALCSMLQRPIVGCKTWLTPAQDNKQIVNFLLQKFHTLSWFLIRSCNRILPITHIQTQLLYTSSGKPNRKLNFSICFNLTVRLCVDIGVLSPSPFQSALRKSFCHRKANQSFKMNWLWAPQIIMIRYRKAKYWSSQAVTIYSSIIQLLWLEWLMLVAFCKLHSSAYKSDKWLPPNTITLYSNSQSSHCFCSYLWFCTYQGFC